MYTLTVIKQSLITNSQSLYSCFPSMYPKLRGIRRSLTLKDYKFRREKEREGVGEYFNETANAQNKRVKGGE